MADLTTLEINVIDLLDSTFDSDIADALRPTVQEAAFKRLFGQRIVDEIVNRTQDGIDKNGRSMGKYSKSYKESMIFQIYKSGGAVDLTLTGDMLESLKTKNKRGASILIFIEGALNNAKALGHITGRYGKKGRARDSGGRPIKRDFLGVPESLKQKMFKESIKDYRAASRFTQAEMSI